MRDFEQKSEEQIPNSDVLIHMVLEAETIGRIPMEVGAVLLQIVPEAETICRIQMEVGVVLIHMVLEVETI